MTQQTARSRALASQTARKPRGQWIREPHVRHRDYSPTLGRFVERDPIGFEAGDNNWYRFVVNGPTGKVDASGLCEKYIRDGYPLEKVLDYVPHFPSFVVSITTVRGIEYSPRNPKELYYVLRNIQGAEDIIANFAIKAHGCPAGMAGLDDEAVLEVLPGSPEVYIVVNGTAQNVAPALKVITDSRTEINLNGCTTAELAKNLSGILKDDVTVTGYPIPVFGVPCTTKSASVVSRKRYRNGVEMR